MPNLLFRHDRAEWGCTELVSPVAAPLRYITLRRIRLGTGCSAWTWETGGEEAVLDVLAGRCTVQLEAEPFHAEFLDIGSREHVFAGRPTMVYIPRGGRVSVIAEGADFEGLLASAPARAVYPPAVVFPDEMEVRTVGKDNWQRTVVTGVGENVEADRLIVGETVNPPGNWSSSPPHKHDASDEGEVPMEEVYYYRLNPPQGFGLQRVYTPPGAPNAFDVAYSVAEGDVVVIPRGYHPVVAAPGYQLLYVWVLAGDERRYGAWSDDPQHGWIKGLGG
ncbi:MAG: 5-deoxy-glucuronate isomerase [Chthonomonadales bacterium]